MRILSYIYSEGPAATVPTGALGASAPFQINNTIAVVEQATPGTTVYARLAGPSDFVSALQELTDQLNLAAPAGAPNGTYLLTYDVSLRRMVFASTNATAFHPVLSATMAKFLGLTQSLAGWATSWTGAAAPLGLVECLGLAIHPLEDFSKVVFEKFRHNRPLALAWGNLQTFGLTIWLRAADAAALAAGWCVTGAIRVEQGSGGVFDLPYADDNPRGYFDGYVIGAGDLRSHGSTEDFVEFDLIVGVPR